MIIPILVLLKKLQQKFKNPKGIQMKKSLTVLLVLVFAVITNAAQITHTIVIPNAGNLTGIGAFSPNQISVTANSGIHASTDKGVSWIISYADSDSILNLFDIAVENNIGFVVGYKMKDATIRGLILKTSNSGLSWNRLTLPEEFNNIPYKVAFKGSKVYVVGDNSRVWCSTDGGETWNTQISTGWFNSVGHLSILNDEIYYTNSSYFSKSNDGINWNSVQLPQYYSIGAVAKNAQGIYGVGYENTEYYPMVSHNVPYPGNVVFTDVGHGQFNDIKFLDASIGFMCGRGLRNGENTSLIYKTTNSGMTWDKVYDSLSFVNENTGLRNIALSGNMAYSCGKNSVVSVEDIVTNTGNGQAQGIPEKYSLSQNYPNPFNPETKISFNLPKSGPVSLKVYNLIGQEMVTIVAEIKNAGTYTYDFNGYNLSSGMYFYTLQTTDFKDTKKMTLVK